MKVRIGSRGSRLALTQAKEIRASLISRFPDIDVEITIIQSKGDQVLDSPLWQIGGKGVFTKEIELALLQNEIDLAVHSLKDLPTEDTPGLCIAAVTTREAPGDTLLAREEIDLAQLGENDAIGTSSLRRQAQLVYNFPQLIIKDLRGNVPTRIKKMMNGEYTAIVLASAGLKRLEEKAPYMKEMPFELMLPAPGQGSLGLQIRDSDEEMKSIVESLHDFNSHACCGAERSLLSALGGGCQAPLGAYAKIINSDTLELEGRLLSRDHREQIDGRISGPLEEFRQLGVSLASKFHSRGAEELLAGWRDDPAPKFSPFTQSKAENSNSLDSLRILITREEDADGDLSRLIRKSGGAPVCMPMIKTVYPDVDPLEDVAPAIEDHHWLLVTSRRTAEYLVKHVKMKPEVLEAHKIKIGVVGDSSKEILTSAGYTVNAVSPTNTSRGLIEKIESNREAIQGARFLYLVSKKAPSYIEDSIGKRGGEVTRIDVYDTCEDRSHDELLAPLLERNELDIITFCSPTAVYSFESFLKRYSRLNSVLKDQMTACSIGPTTTEALKNMNWKLIKQASSSSFEGLVDVISEVSSRPS